MKKYLYSIVWFDDPALQENTAITLGSILKIMDHQAFDKLFLWRIHDVVLSSNYKMKEAKLKEIIKEQYNIPVEIHDMEKEHINEVGRWKDIFYNSLQFCLRKESPDDVLWYINFSSGTPIMVSSLTHAILSINQPLWAIYANDEIVPMAKKYELTKKSIIHAIKNHRDPITTAEIKQLQETAVRSQIRQMLQIKAYDAASLLLSDFPSTYYQTLKSMCDGANALMSLDLDEARNHFRYTPLHSLLPATMPQEIKKLIAYAANLQIKVEHKDYFDFVMRMSPLLYELCFTILIDYTHFPLAAIINSDSFASSLIPKANLHLIPPQFKGFFTSYFYKYPQEKHVMLTTPLLIHLISYQLTANLSLVNELNQLRSFEENIRNEFAHVFSDYSIAYIEKKTGQSPKQIVTLFKTVIRKVAYEHVSDTSVFDLYDTINDTILNYIEL